MRVAILHNEVAAGASQSDQDVLVQVEVVGQSLGRLGHESEPVPVNLNLDALVQRFARRRPDVVFNLVESLGGSDRLSFIVPALLDTLGIAYTGSPAAALFLSGDKPAAKSQLLASGLPTPDWTTGDSSVFRPESDFGQPASTEDMDQSPSSPARKSGQSPAAKMGAVLSLAGRFIIKPIWEHASLGMDADAVVEVADAAELARKLDERTAKTQCPSFAERFVDGREFNLSVLAGPNGPEVLPPAEIDFSAFAEGTPKIVDYAAKWHEDSFAYSHTPRTFEFTASDRKLLDELAALAEGAWRCFGLRGYARVDFRVDTDSRPWILEINANPCLSPDAGFAAAVDRAGIGFDMAVARILADT
jgi:D-alanine-D-alanine ligase